MPLQSLVIASCLNAYHDEDSGVLFLEWHGRLTLAAVQVAGVQVAQHLITQPYRQALVSMRRVSYVGPEVAPWFRTMLLPGVSLFGIEHLAWVCNTSLNITLLAQQCISCLPTLETSLFSDEEHAITWLHRQAEFLVGLANSFCSVAETHYLRRIVTVLTWRTLTALARHPLWLLSKEQGEYSSSLAPPSRQIVVYQLA